MTNLETKSLALELLEKAYLKIKDRKGWTQGCMAKNSEGVRVAPYSSDAQQFCMLGACYSVVGSYKDPFANDCKYLSLAFHELVHSSVFLYKEISLQGLNDYVGHEAVCKVFEAAINKLKTETGVDYDV